MKNIFNRYWWGIKYWEVRGYFFPQQKWLIKKIPNTFCDKVELIPICIFESFLHFIEHEGNALDGIYHEEYETCPLTSKEYAKIRKDVRTELEEVYKYVKHDRPLLQKNLDESYPESICGGIMSDPVYTDDTKTEIKHHVIRSCEQQFGMPYKEAYAEVNRLEDLIEERDTWAMTTIVKHRGYLWT